MTYVPFTGGAPAVNALLGQHVNSVIANYSEVVEHLKAGKLRALAATGKTRIEPLPDLPTIAESGYKDFDMSVWFGLIAPAKTPPTQLCSSASWFTAAMQVPEIKQKLATLTPLSGGDLRSRLRGPYPQAARGKCPHRARGEYQGGSEAGSFVMRGLDPRIHVLA